MKAIAILLLSASSALAQPITVGMWCSDEVEVCLKFKGMNFDMFEYGGGKFATCKISSWPINTPTAHAKCSDKIDRDVTINSDSVLLNGAALTRFKDIK